MTDTLMPGIGTSLLVSSALPIIPTAAGYRALDWTLVGHVTELPRYGRQHVTVEHVEIKDGVVRKYHGTLDMGTITVPLAYESADAGQNIVRLALRSRARIAWEVRFPNGDSDFFQGKVMAFRRRAMPNEVLTGETQAAIETAVVEADALEPPLVVPENVALWGTEPALWGPEFAVWGEP